MPYTGQVAEEVTYTVLDEDVATAGPVHPEVPVSFPTQEQYLAGIKADEADQARQALDEQRDIFLSLIEAREGHLVYDPEDEVYSFVPADPSQAAICLHIGSQDQAPWIEIVEPAIAPAPKSARTASSSRSSSVDDAASVYSTSLSPLSERSRQRRRAMTDSEFDELIGAKPV